MSYDLWQVVAETEKGTPWQVVLKTRDADYARATYEQFVEAGVRVRLDEPLPQLKK